MKLNVIDGGFGNDKDRFSETLTEACKLTAERIKDNYKDTAKFVLLVETSDGLEIASNSKFADSYMITGIANNIIREAYMKARTV